MLLAPDALYFADPGVGVQFGQGGELVAGLFDVVFHAEPVEHRALGLLLVRCVSSGFEDRTQRCRFGGARTGAGVDGGRNPLR